ncbi:hypothetical protein Bpfe_002621, partial [Biomphalaria pfeifferi]
MKHFLCPFYLACIIVLIKTKEDFLSSKTLKVGEPLEVRCNFFVFGNNAPIIKCAYAAALLKSDETNTTLLPLADLPIKSNKK